MEHSFYDNKVLPNMLPFNNRLYIIHKNKPDVVSFKYNKDYNNATVRIKFKDNKDVSSNAKNVYINNIDALAKESIEEQIYFAIGSQEQWDNKRKDILIKSAHEAIKNIGLYYRSLNDKLKKLDKYGYDSDEIKYDINKLNEVKNKLNEFKEKD